MKIKDPFSSVPSIEEEDLIQLRSPTHDNSGDTENFTKGNTPRNLQKTLSKIAVPVLFAGILIWVLVPDGTLQLRKEEKKTIVVDESKQATDTTNLLDRLKEEAKAPLPTKLTSLNDEIAHAGMEMKPPVPPELSAKEQAELLKQKTELLKRDEEIRASALEAGGGSFKLIKSDDNDTATTTNALSTSTTLQSDMQEFNRRREEANTKKQALQDNLLASLAPKEVPKARSINEEFITNQSAKSGTDSVRLQPPIAQYVVNEGTIIRSVLITGVNSDLPGKIKAMVTSDVYDSQGRLAIPKGSFLNGVYNSGVVVGQERVLIAMTRLIFPNGSWLALSTAVGADMIGQSGVEADVNNHFIKMFASSLVLGGASLLLPKDQSSISSTTGPAGVTNGGAIVALSLNEILQTTLERNKRIAPTLTIKPGDEFIFLVSKDMEVVPYRQ